MKFPIIIRNSSNNYWKYLKIRGIYFFILGKLWKCISCSDLYW